MIWLDQAVVGSLASVWSLCGYGLAGSGGCGLMLGSRSVGLARWCGGGVAWMDRAAVGSLASSQVCVVAWGFAMV